MAKYEFKVLSQDEQDDIVVEFLLAQERDLFCHQLNAERFTNMDIEAIKDQKLKSHMGQMVSDTDSRIEQVQGIVDATQRQLPPKNRLDAAIARVRAKQNKTA